MHKLKTLCHFLFINKDKKLSLVSFLLQFLFSSYFNRTPNWIRLIFIKDNDHKSNSLLLFIPSQFNIFILKNKWVLVKDNDS